jgi:hypothetical protein
MGRSVLRHFWIVFAIALLVTIVTFLMGHRAFSGPALIVTFASLALYCMSIPY